MSKVNVLLDYSSLTEESLIKLKDSYFKSYEELVTELLKIDNSELSWLNFVQPLINHDNLNIDLALLQMKDFSTDAKQVQAVAYGSIGDAYSELKKNDEAIEYYKKAGTHFPEDEAISSEYLFRAASFLELNVKNDAAIEIYKQIKQNYPKSEKGFSIDKYINRLQVQP